MVVERNKAITSSTITQRFAKHSLVPNDKKLIEEVASFVTKKGEIIQNYTLHILGECIDEEFKSGKSDKRMLLRLKDGELDVSVKKIVKGEPCKGTTLSEFIGAALNGTIYVTKSDERLLKEVAKFVHKLDPSKPYAFKINGENINIIFNSPEIPEEEFLCEWKDGNLRIEGNNENKKIKCKDLIRPEDIDKEIRNPANLLSDEDQELLHVVADFVVKEYNSTKMENCTIFVAAKKKSFIFVSGEGKYPFRFPGLKEPNVLPVEPYTFLERGISNVKFLLSLIISNSIIEKVITPLFQLLLKYIYEKWKGPGKDPK